VRYHPERQIAEKYLRTVLVKIDSTLGHGIFGIGLRGKITGWMQNARPRMFFLHCL